MYQSSYYREQAERARRLAEIVTAPDVISILAELACDYVEIADDLDRGAIENPSP